METNPSAEDQETNDGVTSAEVEETPAEEAPATITEETTAETAEDETVDEVTPAPVTEVTADETTAAEIAEDETADDETTDDETVDEAEPETVAEVTADETTAAETAEDETAEDETTGDESAATQDGRIRRAALLEGTITATSPTSVTVDLGEGAEGIIPTRELERLGRNIIESFKEGEKILVFVVNPSNHEGKTILSVNRAIEEMDWQNAEKYSTEGTVYEGNIAGYNKGGLIVRFGRLRGFVPQSQIADARQARMKGKTPEERFGGMVNDEIFVKVMEVDRSRNRLILSERSASRERREERKKELIDELTVGETREGRVVSLEDFGAFVDVGGAEGLVHLTEITWKHITHPRDVLSIGQTVKVEVISIDPQRKRIGLSIKRQEADPWDEVATTFQVGDLVQGTVTKLTKFGAFARLVEAEDIEGLIHISELSEQRVAHPREVVSEEEKLTLRIVKIDVKNRRLGLSLKAVNSAEWLDRDLQAFASNTDNAEDSDGNESTEDTEEDE